MQKENLVLGQKKDSTRPSGHPRQLSEMGCAKEEQGRCRRDVGGSQSKAAFKVFSMTTRGGEAQRCVEVYKTSMYIAPKGEPTRWARTREKGEGVNLQEKTGIRGIGKIVEKGGAETPLRGTLRRWGENTIPSSLIKKDVR